MTEVTLAEMWMKMNKAVAIKRQIDELKRINGRRDEIKIWGVCLYFDEGCEDRLYADLMIDDVHRFLDEFVTNRILHLEQEFSTLRGNGGKVLEDSLKELVSEALETKLGHPVSISHEEWEEAKRDSLNDIYTNKLCFIEKVAPEDFINIMVGILYCATRNS